MKTWRSGAPRTSSRGRSSNTSQSACTNVCGRNDAEASFNQAGARSCTRATAAASASSASMRANVSTSSVLCRSPWSASSEPLTTTIVCRGPAGGSAPATSFRYARISLAFSGTSGTASCRLPPQAGLVDAEPTLRQDARGRGRNGLLHRGRARGGPRSGQLRDGPRPRRPRKPRVVADLLRDPGQQRVQHGGPGRRRSAQCRRTLLFGVACQLVQEGTQPRPVRTVAARATRPRVCQVGKLRSGPAVGPKLELTTGRAQQAREHPDGRVHLSGLDAGDAGGRDAGARSQGAHRQPGAGPRAPQHRRRLGHVVSINATVPPDQTGSITWVTLPYTCEGTITRTLTSHTDSRAGNPVSNARQSPPRFTHPHLILLPYWPAAEPRRRPGPDIDHIRTRHERGGYKG